MIIPVKCFTCGNVLANKYLYYLEQVSKRKESEKIEQNEMQYLTEDNIEKSIEGEELDKLNLVKPCCRRHMLTHIDVF